MCGQASTLGGCGLVEDVSHVLGTVVGDFDTNMRLICREGCVESFLLTLREPITRGSQDKPDVVKGITLAPAVTSCALLDATASLTWGVASECDDVTGAARAGCLLGAGQAMAFLLSLEGIERRDSHPHTEVLSRSASQFLYTVPDLPSTSSTQAGRGTILPASGP